MCLNFAKKCLKNDKVKKMFSKKGKSHAMKKRGQEYYKIKMIKTKRYRKSAIPYMTRLLNIDHEKRSKIVNGDY